MKKQLPFKSVMWALYILIIRLSVTQATLKGNPHGVVVVTASMATPMREEELARVETPVHRLWADVGGDGIDAMLRRLTRAAREPPLTLDTAVVTALNPHDENAEPILMTSSLQKKQNPMMSKDYSIFETELEFLKKMLGTRRNLTMTSDGDMHEDDSATGIHDLQRENVEFTSGSNEGLTENTEEKTTTHLISKKNMDQGHKINNKLGKKALRRPTGALWGEKTDLQCCHSNSLLCNISSGAISSQEMQRAMYGDWIHAVRVGASPQDLALRVACPRRRWRALGWVRGQELLEERKLPMDEGQPPLLTAFRTAVARQRPHAGFAAVRILAPLNGEKLRRLVELLDISSSEKWMLSKEERDSFWSDDLEGDLWFVEKRLVVMVVAVPAAWGAERHGTVALYAGGPGAKKLNEVEYFLKFEDVMRDILGSLHENNEEIDGGGAGGGGGVREEELMAVEVPREAASYRHVKIHVASVRLVPCGGRACLLPPLRLCLHPTQENCQKTKVNNKGLLKVFPYPKRTTPLGTKKENPNRKHNRPSRSLEQHNSSSNTSWEPLEISEQKETSAAWLDQVQDDPETTDAVEIKQPISPPYTGDDGVNEEGLLDIMEFID